MTNFDVEISNAEEYKMNSPVPGVGPIAGLRVKDDVVYVTRNKGSVMVAWQADADGWVQYTKGKVEAVLDQVLDGATVREIEGPNQL